MQDGRGRADRDLAEGELITHGHPPSRYVAEERERRLLDVSLVGDATPGGPVGPVDLDSGVVEVDARPGASDARP